MPGMLDGLRVIELSHVMAAPTCGLMLSDMGADVIKVERLPGGDDIRNLAPFVNGVSNPFAMMNRNKRGIALNLRTEWWHKRPQETHSGRRCFHRKLSRRGHGTLRCRI